MPRVIGLTGRAGAGKGAAAEVLVNRFGFVQIDFADPLYQCIEAITGIPRSVLKTDRTVKESPLARFGGVSPRRMLQTLGTEWGRDTIHPDLWVEAWLAQVAAARGRDIVATDVRFVNEANAIRSLGGRVWMVIRPGADCALSGAAAAHSSEGGGVHADRVLYNVDDLRRFQAVVGAIAGGELEAWNAAVAG